MRNPVEVTKAHQDAMWNLAQRLEPIYRTLVSPGFEESLNVIHRELPLNIKKYPSGQKVFDWVIPKEWSVKEGYIANLNGEKYFDQKDFPLLVGPYSQPFSGEISRKDLLPHLHTLPHLPDAFALCPSYYTEDWKLGVPHSFKEALKEDQYFVHIDSEFRPGHLCIGEHYLPGKTRKEILISTYLCHPMMANDNMSGVVVATELFKILSRQKDRYYSYRLIIIPETIGSITFLYHHQDIISDIIGAFNITCCGDPGHITFKKTWNGQTIIDHAAVQALKDLAEQHAILDFYLSGSDERQFNAPGFRIPMATVMRTPPSDFLEYHSSNDSLSCITPQHLGDTLKYLLYTLFILENNQIYKNRYMTEPFLTRYGIFKQVHRGNYGVFSKKTSGFDPGYLNQVVIHETDGARDLLDICRKYGCSFFELLEACREFQRVGLLESLSDVVSNNGLQEGLVVDA